MEDSDRFHRGAVVPAPTHDNAVPMLATCILAPAARMPGWLHGSILNGYHLAHNSVEIVLAGPTRESFRQTALGLSGLTTMLVDCPAWKDQLLNTRPTPRPVGQAPPSSACADAACRPSRTRTDWLRWGALGLDLYRP